MDADTRYSTLTIHSLLLGDSGTYTCVSVNPRGSSTDSVIIEVLRKYHITQKDDIRHAGRAQLRSWHQHHASFTYFTLAISYCESAQNSNGYMYILNIIMDGSDSAVTDFHCACHLIYDLASFPDQTSSHLFSVKNCELERMITNFLICL